MTRPALWHHCALSQARRSRTPTSSPGSGVIFRARVALVDSPQHASEVHNIYADFSDRRMPARKGDRSAPGSCSPALPPPQCPRMLFGAAGMAPLPQQRAGKLRMVQPPTAPRTWRCLWKSSQPGALQQGRAPCLSPGRHRLVVFYRAGTLAQPGSTVSLVGTREHSSNWGEPTVRVR